MYNIGHCDLILCMNEYVLCVITWERMNGNNNWNNKTQTFKVMLTCLQFLFCIVHVLYSVLEIRKIRKASDGQLCINFRLSAIFLRCQQIEDLMKNTNTWMSTDNHNSEMR